MSSLIGTLRKSTGRASDVLDRLAGLEQAVDAARGRLDDALVDDAGDVVARATARLRLSGDHTVVALAGSTGCGEVVAVQRARRPRHRRDGCTPSDHVLYDGLHMGAGWRRRAPGLAGHPAAPPGRPHRFAGRLAT